MTQGDSLRHADWEALAGEFAVGYQRTAIQDSAMSTLGERARQAINPLTELLERAVAIPMQFLSNPPAYLQWMIPEGASAGTGKSTKKGVNKAAQHTASASKPTITPTQTASTSSVKYATTTQAGAAQPAYTPPPPRTAPEAPRGVLAQNNLDSLPMPNDPRAGVQWVTDLSKATGAELSAAEKAHFGRAYAVNPSLATRVAAQMLVPAGSTGSAMPQGGTSTTPEAPTVAIHRDEWNAAMTQITAQVPTSAQNLAALMDGAFSSTSIPSFTTRVDETLGMTVITGIENNETLTTDAVFPIFTPTGEVATEQNSNTPLTFWDSVKQNIKTSADVVRMVPDVLSALWARNQSTENTPQMSNAGLMLNPRLLPLAGASASGGSGGIPPVAGFLAVILGGFALGGGIILGADYFINGTANSISEVTPMATLSGFPLEGAGSLLSTPGQTSINEGGMLSAIEWVPGQAPPLSTAVGSPLDAPDLGFGVVTIRPTNDDFRNAVADRMLDNFGNYHAYDWELKEVNYGGSISANNPDPDIGEGDRYYLVFYGTDENGIDRELRISVNYNPNTEEFGVIKYSGSDEGSN